MKKIQVTVKAHGVFNSPHDGHIIHVDPDREEKELHSPLLTADEARVAFERGLIEDPADAKETDDETETGAEGENTDPNMIGKQAAERTAEFAEQDDAAGAGSGSLDSRSSTAWPDRERVEGPAEGFTDGVRTSDAGDDRPAPSEIDQDSGDDDAPPAPKPKRGQAKTS